MTYGRSGVDIWPGVAQLSITAKDSNRIQRKSEMLTAIAERIAEAGLDKNFQKKKTLSGSEARQKMYDNQHAIVHCTP